ncbi:MAG: dihydrodipicolinate synthase family protein [Vicinamibacterales bacterium]
MLQLKGVIPALTTPFTDDRALDVPAFRRLVDHVIADGVHGILVAGCTGESWALEDDDRFELFRAAAEQAAGRVPVVVGCGAMLARHAIRKVKQAERAGCDAVMVQPPSYVMPGEHEVLDYYLQIVEASSLPIVLYNIPRRTGVNLSVTLVERLAEEPKVVALKESSKDFLLLSEMVRRVGDRIGVFAGYVSVLGLGALAIGAVGYMDSSTAVLGSRSVEFYRAATSGDLVTARRIQNQMARLNAGFFGIGTFPAAVKAALDLLGRPGGWTRDPIRPLTSEERHRVRAVLEEVGLLPAVVPA